jgi:hypothetical protein
MDGNGKDKTMERQWRRASHGNGWKTYFGQRTIWISPSPMGSYDVKEGGFLGKTYYYGESLTDAKNAFEELVQQGRITE